MPLFVVCAYWPGCPQMSKEGTGSCKQELQVAVRPWKEPISQPLHPLLEQQTLLIVKPSLRYLRCFVMKYCACHYSLKLVDSSENTFIRLQPEACV